MSAEETQKQQTADGDARDLRYRKRFFPNAEEVIFHTSTKGYAPLPIMLRKLLRHLTPPETRVLIYLYTRASQYRICYPTIDEIAEELGVHRKNVTPHIKSLERKHLIYTRAAGGRKYFLVLDPRVALEAMVASGEIQGEELFMVNELARELKRSVFGAKKPKA